MHIKLTKRVLERTVNETSKDIFLRDTTLKGFGVRVTPKGGKGFFAEGRLRKGPGKRIALGRYPVLDLEDARERARSALLGLRNGVAPLAINGDASREKSSLNTSEELSQTTLQMVIDEYFKSRPIRSEKEYRAVLARVFGDWLTRPVRSITRQEIEGLYREQAFVKGHKAQTAKAMRYLNSIMTFAQRVKGSCFLIDVTPTQ